MKRGLSPVVGVVFLVAIAVALALVVFFWSRGTVLQLSPDLSYRCYSISFRSEVFYDGGYRLALVNDGNEPLAGVVVKKYGVGSAEVVTRYGITGSSVAPPHTSEPEEIDEITPGESVDFALEGVGNGDEVLVVPQIIYTDAGSEVKVFTCPDEFGAVVEID